MRVLGEIVVAWTAVSLVFCFAISRALHVMDLSVRTREARKTVGPSSSDTATPTAA